MRASFFFAVVAVSLVGESLSIPILGGLTKTPGVAPITNSDDLSAPMQAAPSVVDSLGSTLNSVVGTLLGKRDPNAPSYLTNPPQGLPELYSPIQQAGTTGIDDPVSSLPALGTLPKAALGSVPKDNAALGPASSLSVVGSLPQAGTLALGSSSLLPVVGKAATSALGSSSLLSQVGTLTKAGTSALDPVASLPVIGTPSAASTTALGRVPSLPAAGNLSQVGPSARGHASSSPSVGTLSKAPLVGTILPGLNSVLPPGAASASSSSPGGLAGGLL